MTRLFHLFVILHVSVFFARVQAQQLTLEWANDLVTHGSSGLGFTTQQAIDASGNVYTTGYFKGTYDFDPGPDTFMLTATSTRNIFILKQDSAGNFLWAASIDGDEEVIGNYVAGAPIAVDLDGNIYVTGFFKGTTDFDPGPGAYLLTSTGSRSDIFVLKLDGAANFKWAKSMGSGDFGLYGSVPSSIALDDTGSIYITGGFAGTVDFDPGAGNHPLTAHGFFDTFLLKTDFEGNYLWAIDIGRGYSENFAYSIALTGSGEILLSGVFVGTIDFDPGGGAYYLAATSDAYNTFLLKLDVDGNFLWAKQWGGEKSVFGLTVKVNALDEIYMTGLFQHTIDFDPGPGFYSLSGGHLYVLKLSANGQFKWVRKLVNAHGVSMNGTSGSLALDSFGNLYLTGTYVGPTDFDTGPDTLPLSSNGFMPGAIYNYTDIFLLSLDPEGNFRWVSTVGGPGIDLSTSIHTHDAAYIYFTGNYNGVMDIDPGTGVNNLPLHQAALQSNDVFIAKWRQMIVPIVDTAAVETLIYPNPVTDVFSIHLGENSGGLRVEIYGRDGKLVYAQHYAASNVITVPLEAPPGVYFVCLKGDNGQQTVYKVVKE